ncbi:hypothetical protein AB4Y45_35040 [Paraburkholderia sp. EG287A]|uniref:hypothetical protein n=1 Tax=Paraburkholderia sp. EG287A TaxID=3237012 RepID=UPI0034D1D39F
MQISKETGATCGTCKNWLEKTTQCPGMGYCQHPDAAKKITASLVPVSCFLMAAGQPCKMIG